MNNALDWSSLAIGETYFLMGYHDSHRLYPYVETLVYIGVEVQEPTDGKLHIFEYAEAHLSRADISKYEEENTIQFSDSAPSCIGDLNGLIDELTYLQQRLKR